MYLEELSEKKWKADRDDEKGKLYVVMREVSDETYLHCLCKKIDMNYYEKLEEALNIRLISELKEFYERYNGCRLFLSSINIYGVGIGKSSPMEFILNDSNMYGEIKDKKFQKQPWMISCSSAVWENITHFTNNLNIQILRSI